MELSQKQKEIVFTNENKTVVISAASAGKTATLTARIKYLLDSGVNPKELVAITFTNLAAEEIRDRVGEKAKDCFIGTVHSYCNYLLVSNGIDTRDLLEREDFDGLFHLIKDHPESVKFVDHLFLDEAQDSNAAQFDFFLDTIKPKHFMFIGDFRQSIYQFNGSTPERLIKLTHESDVTVYDLNENYRNAPEILDYAKMVIRQNGLEYLDKSIAMRDTRGSVKTVEYSPNAIAKTIKKMGNFGSWFLLCRWNNDIPDIAAACERNGVPYSIIRKSAFSSNAELQEKMKDNTVKIMTIHQSKGLEADNVVVIGATLGGGRGNPQENTCVNYVAATRARNLLVWTYQHRYQKKTVRSWE